MSKSAPYGTFPTNYGVEVPVYRPTTPDPRDPDAVVFDMRGAAFCFGIYGEAQRDRFVADATRMGTCPPMEEYGGHPVPTVALPRPRRPAYPRITSLVHTPIEAWVTAVMDEHRWCDRANFLIQIIGENMEQPSSGGLMKEVYPLGLSILLTGTLEHLCETEIDCIEAAALYALTENEEWRRAGCAWLHPFRDTWFRDWRDTRPRYTAFAHALHQWFDLPEWLRGNGGAP